jgi:spore coat protein U-like protein
MSAPRWARSVALSWLLGSMGSSALAACGIAGGGAAISFGAYHPLTLPGKLSSADVDSTGSVTVSCSGLAQAVSYTLKLGGGRSNNVSARLMGAGGGGSDMRYNLYVNAAHSLVWGDGTAGSAVTGSIGAGSNSNTHYFYGRIPGGQNSVRPGAFSDLLVITLEYAP